MWWYGELWDGRGNITCCACACTGELGGMCDKRGALDDLDEGVAGTRSAGSMLTSISGSSCERSDDVDGDKDMVAAPRGGSRVRGC